MKSLYNALYHCAKRDLPLAFIGDWSVAMPAEDNDFMWAAHHPDGYVVCAVNTKLLRRKVAIWQRSLQGGKA